MYSGGNLEGIARAADIIRRSQNITVLTHEKPDGDAIGSILSLALGLNSLGKNTLPCVVDGLAEVYSFLPSVELIRHQLPENADLLLIVDANSPQRTGWLKIEPAFFEKGITTWVIDHHPPVGEPSAQSILDPTVSAAGELIFDLLKELQIKIDKDIATCLLTCLSTDTGSFQFSNTSERTLRMASELVLAGGRLAKIAENVYNKKSLPQLKLWGKVLASLRRDSELGVNVAVVTTADLEECGATDEDLEGVVSLLNTVPETRATFLVSERGEEIKGSIRTYSDSVNVAEMAKLWGGGGHIKAAGFNVSGHLKHDGPRWKLV